MILGLSGAKDSGKDIVAAYLIKEHGFERRAFADPLKKSVAALFNIPFSDVDKLKNDIQATVGLKANWFDSSDRNPEPAMVPQLSKKMTFHDFIDAYAEKAHKEVFGENFWLDFTMPLAGFYSGRNIVVTDMRFDNEAVRIRSCGGYRICVGTCDIQNNYIDYFLVNDDDDFERKIDNMIVDLATVDTRYKTVMRDE